MLRFCTGIRGSKTIHNDFGGKPSLNFPEVSQKMRSQK